MENPKTTFKVAVQRAFKDSKYPHGESLVQDFFGHYGIHITNFFLNNTWMELKDKEMLVSYALEMYVLSDSAFAYFLPAFLINIHAENIGIKSVIYQWLTPPIDSIRMQVFNKRMRLFTLDQCKVILRFIKSFLKEEFYREEHRSEKTIKYWKNLIKIKRID